MLFCTLSFVLFDWISRHVRPPLHNWQR